MKAKATIEIDRETIAQLLVATAFLMRAVETLTKEWQEKPLRKRKPVNRRAR
jgi:hypothetical protein